MILNILFGKGLQVVVRAPQAAVSWSKKKWVYQIRILLCEHYRDVSIFQEALDVVHVSKEDQERVFAMLAAVLWLGNVSFTPIDNENHVEPVADEGNNNLKELYDIIHFDLQSLLVRYQIILLFIF